MDRYVMRSRAIAIALGLASASCGGGGTGTGGGGGSTSTGTSASASASTTVAASSSASAGGPCGTITYVGECHGDVLVWCENDVLQVHDCAADGEVCGYQDDVVGHNCLAPPGAGFGYPVGDKASYPAGGWVVTQVLGHWLPGYGGHLAQDIAVGEAATANAPVYSIGDGIVLYAGPNTSSYVNVVLVQHDVPGEGVVCSFYGHLGSVTVAEGQAVARGDQIATVLDWQAQFGAPNSHLHYVILSAALCNASDAASGALVCGYDATSGPNGIDDLSTEPYSYTSIGDVCGDQAYPDAFISPTQFIEAHHF